MVNKPFLPSSLHIIKKKHDIDEIYYDGKKYTGLVDWPGVLVCYVVGVLVNRVNMCGAREGGPRMAEQLTILLIHILF